MKVHKSSYKRNRGWSLYIQWSTILAIPILHSNNYVHTYNHVLVFLCNTHTCTHTHTDTHTDTQTHTYTHKHVHAWKQTDRHRHTPHSAGSSPHALQEGLGHPPVPAVVCSNPRQEWQIRTEQIVAVLWPSSCESTKIQIPLLVKR